jgi:hypothetical protein
MAVLPFFVFQPEGAQHVCKIFFRWYPNSSRTSAAFEVKNWKKIIRDLDSTEKSYYAHPEKNS